MSNAIVWPVLPWQSLIYLSTSRTKIVWHVLFQHSLYVIYWLSRIIVWPVLLQQSQCYLWMSHTIVCTSLNVNYELVTHNKSQCYLWISHTIVWPVLLQQSLPGGAKRSNSAQLSLPHFKSLKKSCAIDLSLIWYKTLF